MANQVGVETLSEACDLLQREGYAESVVQRASASTKVALVRQTIQEWSSGEQWLRVVLVGEFNAGKSTVTNALLGRAVAPTDTFRCTTATTVFVPDDREFALLRGADGAVEMSVSDYWAAVKGSPSGACVGEIHMRMPLKVALVDTPGLGTVQQQDAILADDAVRKADLLLWVMDPNDMLSALDGAFLRRAEAIGMPIICLINKADELEDGEADECRREVMRCTGLDGPNVLAVSAADHARTRQDPGMRRLEAIIEEHAARVAQTRSQARQAQFREMAEETARAMRLAVDVVAADCAWCEAQRATLREQAGLVKRDVRESVRVILRNTVSARLQAEAVRWSQAGLADKAEGQRLMTEICETAVRDALDRVADHVHAEARRAWSTLYTDRITDLKAQIERLKSGTVADTGSKEFLADQIRQAQDGNNAVDQGFRWLHSLVTGVATAVVTTLTAHLSIPLAILMAGIGGVPWDEFFGVALRGPSAELEEVVDRVSDRVAEHIARRGVAAATDNYLDQVAAHALDRLVENRTGAQSAQVMDFASDLRQAQSRVDGLLAS